MYEDSDEFTYESDGEDDEYVEQHEIGMEEIRFKSDLQDLVQHSDIDVNWISTDDFVLWSCASGLRWNGPIYDKDDEKGLPVIKERAQYISVYTPSFRTMVHHIESNIPHQDWIDIHEDLSGGKTSNIVNFVRDVLHTCKVDATPYHICRFLFEMIHRLN